MLNLLCRSIKRSVLLGSVIGGVQSRAMCAQVADWKAAKTIYEFSAVDIDGNEVSLEKYRGYVCIIVNEPGDEAQIKDFAASYKVEFDMFSKIEVNGDGAHPLWKWMKEQPKGHGTLGNAIKWNFTKFLINREGAVVKRFSPMEDPVVIEKDLPNLL
ncbi:hypothetical protein XENTR_v10001301 [Xenopus tropicalis]|nr:hypothetical protein XENTR_v10001301 [Xenopus tropicalis]